MSLTGEHNGSCIEGALLRGRLALRIFHIAHDAIDYLQRGFDAQVSLRAACCPVCHVLVSSSSGQSLTHALCCMRQLLIITQLPVGLSRIIKNTFFRHNSFISLALMPLVSRFSDIDNTQICVLSTAKGGGLNTHSRPQLPPNDQ